MKKLLTLTAAALLTVFFTGCMSMGAALGTSTKNKKEYQAAVGTPEDSVVFYGNFNTMGAMEGFSQMNPDFEPDYQFMESQNFISKPVAPGSTYILERAYREDSYYIGNRRYTTIYNWYYSMQGSINPLIINIPKKPGLYYIGAYSTNTFEEGSKAEKIEKSAEYEEMVLKGALKLYKGTAWESAINARIEEINNENKN
jgi:hypothetical protein